MQSRRWPAVLATAALSLSVLAVGAGTSGSATAAQSGSFNRVATYPVFQNVPAGVDPALPTVAEISAVSEDGKTLVYTDALGKRAGFLDITDPANPVGKGSINLAHSGNADDQPTSVAIVGNLVLIVVDTSPSFTAPSGRLDVFRLTDRDAATPVRSIDLGGQPDSIAISADKKYAAIAMENQRDESINGAAIPQLPAGFVQIIDLVNAADASTWNRRSVALEGPKWDAAGLTAPTDAEPEYVDINDANKIALTLQENNGVAIIDAATGTIENVFSAGKATFGGVDTTTDGLFNPLGTVDKVREPDAVSWIDNRYLATANEGDWQGGTRGWTIFDSTTGSVVWDAGNSLENIATQHGLHNDARAKASSKGIEIEGLIVSTIGGKRRGFVGSERSNFVAVYDLTDPAKPVFEQILPTTGGPEGLLTIPSRDLLVVSSENDDAAKLVRASVGIYQYGTSSPAWPTIRSVRESNGFPIGWGALGALSAAPGNPGAIWAASDSAYKTGRIFKVDVTTSPALIERVIEVTDASGAKPAIDIEGLHARSAGGFWAAVEGTNGAGNKVLRLSAEGTIEETVSVPPAVTDHIANWGLEGVTATGSGADEVVYVAVQRPLWVDPAAATKVPLEGANTTRIGRYHVATKTWSWYGYTLESTSTPGDWMGLSEITAIDHDTLAVIERDKLNGTSAKVKRIYTVDLPGAGGTTTPVMLTKKLALDVLPSLRAPKGWTQEKLEGLTIGADGVVYAVTDNDGLKDATGETQFLRLGKAADVFPAPVTPQPEPTRPPVPSPNPNPNPAPNPDPVVKVRTKTTLKALRTKGSTVRLVVRVSPRAAAGKVVIKDGKRRVKVVRLGKGARTRFVVRLKRGKHALRAIYRGNATHQRSVSKKLVVRIR